MCDVKIAPGRGCRGPEWALLRYFFPRLERQRHFRLVRRRFLPRLPESHCGGWADICRIVVEISSPSPSVSGIDAKSKLTKLPFAIDMSESASPIRIRSFPCSGACPVSITATVHPGFWPPVGRIPGALKINETVMASELNSSEVVVVRRILRVIHEIQAYRGNVGRTVLFCCLRHHRRKCIANWSEIPSPFSSSHSTRTRPLRLLPMDRLPCHSGGNAAIPDDSPPRSPT